MSRRNTKSEIAKVGPDSVPEGKTFNYYVMLFDDAMQTAADKLLVACKVFYMICREHPKKRAEFVKKFPRLTRNDWRRMEMIGSGKLHESLARRRGLYVDYMAALPIAEQEDLIDNGAFILDEGRDENSPEGDYRIVQLENLTPAQTRLLFKRGGVRDLSEQAAYLHSGKLTKKKKTAQYAVPIRPDKDGFVVIATGEKIKWEDMVRLCGDEAKNGLIMALATI